MVEATKSTAGQKLEIAVAQMTSTDDIEMNMKMLEGLVHEASSLSPKPTVLFFPENTLFFRISFTQQVQSIDLLSPWVQRLKSLSLQHKIDLHLTTPIKENGRVYNGTLLISGEYVEVIYRKIHLFDIDLQGQRPIRESETFHPGEQPTTFKMGSFLFGSTICYDVRFSELFLKYAKQNVDVIVVPSAFLVKTGRAHWITLLRARAIESQCYIIASAQGGVHRSLTLANETRETFGHSVVIDPWGDIVSERPTGVGLIQAQVNKDLIMSVRQQMPMMQHRRL